MNIFNNAATAFRNFREARRKRKVEWLLKTSAEFKSKLEEEAKRFGIELRKPKVGDYYEILGIKRTASGTAIKEAYHELVKKYHPDVSKDAQAEELTKKINEAYSVLKDAKLRAEYDQTSFKGGGYISDDAAKSISHELWRHYSEARAKDFEDFRAATSVPMRRDALASAIGSVCDWSSRFNRVAKDTFGDFRKYSKRIRKLSALNKRLLKGEKGEATGSLLQENGKMLEEFATACVKVEKGVAAVAKKVKEDIGSQEKVVVNRLKSLL